MAYEPAAATTISIISELLPELSAQDAELFYYTFVDINRSGDKFDDEFEFDDPRIADAYEKVMAWRSLYK